MIHVFENAMFGDVLDSVEGPTLLAVQTSRARRLTRVIEHLSASQGLAFIHWHPKAGVTRNTGQRRTTSLQRGLTHFLLQMEEIILDAVYVIEEPSFEEDEASVSALLLDWIERLEATSSKVVLLSEGALALPDSLASKCLSLSQDEIRAPLEAQAVPFRKALVGQHVMTVSLDKEDRARLQGSLAPHGEDTDMVAPNQVYRSKASGGGTWKALTEALVPHAKAVQEARFLEYFAPEKCQLALPGFQRLRQEVGLEGTCFVDGTAGCGRSLVPFVAAEALGCGVLRFDGAALVEQSSEHDGEAIRKALVSLAQSMAPVVVWFDQLQDSRWEALRPEDWLSFAETTACLVIGTSRGASSEQTTTWSRSFDQRWWVDLPEPDQRREVLSYHLGRRELACGGEELASLAAVSAGLSSAQLEAGILATLDRCLDEERAFSPQRLLATWESKGLAMAPASHAPPGWRSVHGESREVPLIPFTVLG